jgi:hypothetical protein
MLLFFLQSLSTSLVGQRSVLFSAVGARLFAPRKCKEKQMPDSMKQIASGEDRPFIQMTAPALLRLAEANWNDAFCLYQIVAEARTRVW